MRSEIISHFFLLPQKRPLAISCSISGWSVAETQEGGCCQTYWRRARITAELPTVQPSASEASWFSSFRMVSVSWVNVWDRTTRGCFGGVDLGRAINRDHISPGRRMLRGEQIVTRTTAKEGAMSVSLLGLNLPFSLIRDNFDAILQ